MEEETKEEVLETSQDKPKEESKDNFERDVKMFLVDFKLLQKKYNLIVRPVITPFGPDFNISRPEIKK